jgi:hypothetical protein
MRFEASIALYCSLLDGYQRFGGNCRLNLQSRCGVSLGVVNRMFRSYLDEEPTFANHSFLWLTSFYGMTTHLLGRLSLIAELTSWLL